MEEIDSVCVSGDVEVVKVAEEFNGALFQAEAVAHGVGGGGGLLVDGLEDFEDGGDAFAFFVEDEGTVFHAAGGEEADVPGAGEFLWGVLGG